jgi:hypothetical protein
VAAGAPVDAAMNPAQPAQPMQVVNDAVSMEEGLAQLQARLDMYENKAVQSSITLRLESHLVISPLYYSLTSLIRLHMVPRSQNIINQSQIR